MCFCVKVNNVGYIFCSSCSFSRVLQLTVHVFLLYLLSCPHTLSHLPRLSVGPLRAAAASAAAAAAAVQQHLAIAYSYRGGVGRGFDSHPGDRCQHDSSLSLYVDQSAVPVQAPVNLQPERSSSYHHGDAGQETSSSKRLWEEFHCKQ